MKTFKDTIILRKVNNKLVICDYDYYPTREQEDIIKPILEETQDIKEIATKLESKYQSVIVVDSNFENDEYEYSSNLFETLDNIKQKYDFGNDLMDLEPQEAEQKETEFSDMKKELEIKRKENLKIEQDRKNNFKMFDGEEVIYIKSSAKFYRPALADKEYSSSEICTIYGITGKQVDRYLQDLKVIKKYEKLEYTKENNKNYNTLDYSKIMTPLLLPGKKYMIPEKIDFLFKNLCNNNQESVDHLHKCILYKIKNIGANMLPAIVIYGTGGAGKGLIMELLKNIFNENNVTENIGQGTLTGRFGFTGESLIGEFAEISTGSTKDDKLMGNKLKNIIGSNRFEVEKKNIQKYFIKNVTWYFISSNDLKPLQLDVGTGNRRYSVIKVGKNIPAELGNEIFKTLQNPKNVLQYVNWLEQEYGKDLPNVIPALDNKDKKNLEDRSMNELQMFWNNIKETYEEGTKVTVLEIGEKLQEFCMNSDLDLRETKKYMWHESPYVRKTIDINGKKFMGIVIE